MKGDKATPEMWQIFCIRKQRTGYHILKFEVNVLIGKAVTTELIKKLGL